jgi:DNA helicase HerA-like ATPase
MRLESDRVFAVGDTGTGKSYFLSRQILPKYPRVIVLDVTGEMWQQRADVPGGAVVQVETALEVAQAVGRLARNGTRTWRVYAPLSAPEVVRLCSALVPERIATAPSLARAVGGLALYCDELELLAPHAAPPIIAGLWNRGRHVGLSVIGATQYPTSVKPLVRGASRLFVVGQLGDPNAVDYLRHAGFPPLVMQWIERLEFQHLVLFDKRRRRGWLLDRGHSPLATFAP